MTRRAPRGPLSSSHLELLRQLLEADLDVELEVTGASMAPFLKSGDLVTLTPRGEIAPGDVVAFLRSPSRLVMHRVVAEGGESLTTRGDAVPRDDEPVARGEVLGRVARVERRGRRVRLGLGPERRLLAWLSRRGWLRALTRPWR